MPGESIEIDLITPPVSPYSDDVEIIEQDEEEEKGKQLKSKKSPRAKSLKRPGKAIRLKVQVKRSRSSCATTHSARITRTQVSTALRVVQAQKTKENFNAKEHLQV
jgi:hypothetical protein